MVSNQSTQIEQDFHRLQLELAARKTWQIWIETFLCVLLGILIVIGNSATLKIVCFNPSLRTVPNYLIVSLALADLGLGFFTGILCPGVLITSSWPYSEGTCQFNAISALTFSWASILNLTLMGINRYFRIVKQNKYRVFFTPKRTFVYISIVWTLSLVGTILYIPLGFKYVFHPGKFFCFISIEDYRYLVGTVTCFIFLPANVIAFCYINVYRVIKKHNDSMAVNWQTCSSQNLNSHEIKVTRTLFVIVIMFLLCWMPVFIMDSIDIIRKRYSLPREAYVFYSFSVALSSLVNPLVYGILNPNFGREYKKMFAWLTRRISPEPRVENLAQEP